MGSEEKRSFTVKDRRLFTPEGERREAGEETMASSAAAPPPPKASEPESPGQPLEGTPDEAVSFVDFVAGLAAQCSLLLGVYPQAGQEPEEPDLVGARHIISVLEMLRDKTQGRLTAEESDTLASVLYQLRMAYVTLAGRSRA